MSLPVNGTGQPKTIKPMEVKRIPLLEPNLRKELKELINEVLDERYA